MAQEYAISETTLTALADAVRKNVGETKFIQIGVGEPVVKISKTKNATSFTERSGGYGNNQSSYSVISIPGASKIVVDIAYQTEGINYDWVQIAVGSHASPPSTSTYPKYGGNTLTRKELTFEDTNTITFYFKSDSSTETYLGYYAECRGYDEEGNIIKEPIYEEVPNTMTVDTMISTINNLSVGGSLNMKTSYWYNSPTTVATSFTWDFSRELGTNDTTPFYFYMQGYAASTSYPSCLMLSYHPEDGFTVLTQWPNGNNYLAGRYSSATLSAGQLTIKFKDNIYGSPTNNGVEGSSSKYFLFYPG